MPRPPSRRSAVPKITHQPMGVGRSSTPETTSVIEWKSCPPRMRVFCPATGSRVSVLACIILQPRRFGGRTQRGHY
jgi:hypothetical protein